MTIDDYKWLKMTKDDYRWLKVTIDDYKWLLTIDDYTSDYKWLMIPGDGIQTWAFYWYSCYPPHRD